MKKTLLAVALGLVASTSAFAGNMQIDLGTNSFDAGRSIGAADANSRTANFKQFGFNQILATSIYDFSDGSIFGNFYDTNISSELAFANVPASGPSLDGSTTVNLVLPDCPLGQCDIDGLSPLVPPLGSDNEGYLQTWDLQVEYHFDGTLTAGGPVYTGGFFKVFFNDLTVANADYLALTGTLTGSKLDVANLDVFFDITFAVDDFLWIEDANGVFQDAHDVIAAGGVPTLALDTNVKPPIPTADQLLLVVDDATNPNAIRQTELDGSIEGAIPEPATVALLGLGLLGLGLARRRA